MKRTCSGLPGVVPDPLEVTAARASHGGLGLGACRSYCPCFQQVQKLEHRPQILAEAVPPLHGSQGQPGAEGQRVGISRQQNVAAWHPGAANEKVIFLFRFTSKLNY